MSPVRTLCLLRHAKAEKPDLQDYQRHLTGEGRKQANRLGKYLHKQGVTLDLVLTSQAPRALETAQILCHHLQVPDDQLIADRHLYGTTPSDWLEQVRAAPDKVHSMLIVGHNPEMSMLAQQLLGSVSVQLPTCGFVAIALTGNWQQFGDGDAAQSLLYSHFPKGREAMLPENLIMAPEVARAVWQALPDSIKQQLPDRELEPLVQQAVMDMVMRITGEVASRRNKG